MTDGSQAVTDSYLYQAFGPIKASSGTTTNPFRFVGRLGCYDDGMGLLYVRARHYMPATGRFASRDPLAAVLYAYAGNSPTANVDPSGLLSSPERCKALKRACKSAALQVHCRVVPAWDEACQRLNDLIYKYLHECFGITYGPVPPHAGPSPEPILPPWQGWLLDWVFDRWLRCCHGAGWPPGPPGPGVHGGPQGPVPCGPACTLESAVDLAGPEKGVPSFPGWVSILCKWNCWEYGLYCDKSIQVGAFGGEAVNQEGACEGRPITGYEFYRATGIRAPGWDKPGPARPVTCHPPKPMKP